MWLGAASCSGLCFWGLCTFNLRQWWYLEKKKTKTEVENPISLCRAQSLMSGVQDKSSFFCSLGFLLPWPHCSVFPVPGRKEQKIFVYHWNSLQLGGFCKEVVGVCSGPSSWADIPSARHYPAARRKASLCSTPSFMLTFPFAVSCAEKLCFVKVNKIFILNLISPFKA